LDIPELDPDDKSLEYIAFSSQNWNGKFEDGEITDEGTQGFCITFLGESVIHTDQHIVIFSAPRDMEAKISMRYVDNIRSGVINLN